LFKWLYPKTTGYQGAIDSFNRALLVMKIGGFLIAICLVLWILAAIFNW